MIQWQLGHASLATTDRYLSHLAPKDMVEAMVDPSMSVDRKVTAPVGRSTMQRPYTTPSRQVPRITGGHQPADRHAEIAGDTEGRGRRSAVCLATKFPRVFARLLGSGMTCGDFSG